MIITFFQCFTLDFSLVVDGAMLHTSFSGVLTVAVFSFFNDRSLASNLRRWGGGIPLIVGSHCTGVDLRQPVIVLMESLSLVSTKFVWELLVQTGAQ